MEADGVTRIYFAGNDNSARLLHPEEKFLESCLQGQEAKAVLERADYHVMNVEEWVRKEGCGKLAIDQWFVQSSLKKIRRKAPRGEYFSVNRKGWSSHDRYTKLVQAIEERAGKKGFTVLIYPNIQS